MVHGSDEDLTGSVEKVREMFLQEAQENPNFYDPIDIDRVRTDDYTVRRFVQNQRGDVEKGFNMLMSAMKWRKSFGVNDIKPSDFPKEYFETGEGHLYVKDKNDVYLVYLRVKLHKKITELTPLSQKYLVYLIEHCEAEGIKTGKGYGLIWDCLGGTLFNVDLDLLQFLTTVWTNYYPGGSRYIILHELPWILRAIYRLVRSWMPEDLRQQITFADRNSIGDFVGTDNLPDYLNGRCEVSYKTAPSQCKPMVDLVNKEIIQRDVFVKFMDHYRPYLNTKSAS
ncbi:motile sperm domain-containing protein 2-like [Brevipalpus obovatus]|uniref:motile sperm domain-containing protein 2-like n=1 Tax=Brevipalpus obovatus TaxID=246614 RepID=UPI003D9F1398